MGQIGKLQSRIEVEVIFSVNWLVCSNELRHIECWRCVIIPLLDSLSISCRKSYACISVCSAICPEPENLTCTAIDIRSSESYEIAISEIVIEKNIWSGETSRHKRCCTWEVSRCPTSRYNHGDNLSSSTRHSSKWHEYIDCSHIPIDFLDLPLTGDSLISTWNFRCSPWSCCSAIVSPCETECVSWEWCACEFYDDITCIGSWLWFLLWERESIISSNTCNIGIVSRTGCRIPEDCPTRCCIVCWSCLSQSDTILDGEIWLNLVSVCDSKSCVVNDELCDSSSKVRYWGISQTSLILSTEVDLTIGLFHKTHKSCLGDGERCSVLTHCPLGAIWLARENSWDRQDCPRCWDMSCTVARWSWYSYRCQFIGESSSTASEEKIWYIWCCDKSSSRCVCSTSKWSRTWWDRCNAQIWLDDNEDLMRVKTRPCTHSIIHPIEKSSTIEVDLRDSRLHCASSLRESVPISGRVSPWCNRTSSQGITLEPWFESSCTTCIDDECTCSTGVEKYFPTDDVDAAELLRCITFWVTHSIRIKRESTTRKIYIIPMTDLHIDKTPIRDVCCYFNSNWSAKYDIFARDTKIKWINNLILSHTCEIICGCFFNGKSFWFLDRGVCWDEDCSTWESRNDILIGWSSDLDSVCGYHLSCASKRILYETHLSCLTLSVNDIGCIWKWLDDRSGRFHNSSCWLHDSSSWLSNLSCDNLLFILYLGTILCTTCRQSFILYFRFLLAAWCLGRCSREWCREECAWNKRSIRCPRRDILSLKRPGESSAFLVLIFHSCVLFYRLIISKTCYIQEFWLYLNIVWYRSNCKWNYKRFKILEQNNRNEYGCYIFVDVMEVEAPWNVHTRVIFVFLSS